MIERVYRPENGVLIKWTEDRHYEGYVHGALVASGNSYFGVCKQVVSYLHTEQEDKHGD